MRKHPRYGETAACEICDQDIQWLGRESGWRDRGGNRRCVPWTDAKGEIQHPAPDDEHKPYAPDDRRDA